MYWKRSSPRLVLESDLQPGPVLQQAIKCHEHGEKTVAAIFPAICCLLCTQQLLLRHGTAMPGHR